MKFRQNVLKLSHSSDISISIRKQSFSPCHDLMGIYVNWKISNILAYFSQLLSGIDFPFPSSQKSVFFQVHFFPIFKVNFPVAWFIDLIRHKNVFEFDEVKNRSFPLNLWRLLIFQWNFEHLNRKIRPNLCFSPVL